jgi:hypothetical protein
MSHRTGLIDEELTAVAVVHDSGAAEIVDALLPRGQLTATDRQVLAMSAEQADATARRGADVEPSITIEDATLTSLASTRPWRIFATTSAAPR